MKKWLTEFANNMATGFSAIFNSISQIDIF